MVYQIGKLSQCFPNWSNIKKKKKFLVGGDCFLFILFYLKKKIFPPPASLHPPYSPVVRCLSWCHVSLSGTSSVLCQIFPDQLTNKGQNRGTPVKHTKRWTDGQMNMDTVKDNRSSQIQNYGPGDENA